ncbi:hypothetical protein AG1IA_07771 [Rhizoctonia solani AG-1 IA]|uniref:Uncharacterized protein n=1 Tax=Thanatephorus cucumeris (strain AG1-IA) TaxID=983506 RepID=L8WPC8_THACA|nr:hypothetical protein AG1IA_07771 [Rhizoctonia solani AG-1 IA]
MRREPWDVTATHKPGDASALGILVSKRPWAQRRKSALRSYFARHLGCGFMEIMVEFR